MVGTGQRQLTLSQSLQLKVQDDGSYQSFAYMQDTDSFLDTQNKTTPEECRVQ
jgi:hypothetical protein